MEALQQIIPLVFAISLAILVFAVGLDATMEDVLYLVKRPWMLVKAVLAVNVLVPLAAAGLIALFPLSPVVKAGILLMAISPAPPLVPGSELKVGGRRAYSYGLYATLIALSVVVVPVTVAILGAVYGKDVALPPGAVLRNVALTVVLPLALGLGIHVIRPGFAERAAPILQKVAMVLLIVALIPMLIASWPYMVGLIGDGAVVAVVLLVIFALAAGHLLGGPDSRDRGALAVTAATRHPGIALMIAGANVYDPRVNAAILGFLLIGLAASKPYQMLMARRTAREDQAAPYAPHETRPRRR